MQKHFTLFLFNTFLLLSLIGCSEGNQKTVKTDEEILAHIQSCKPSAGAVIPSDIKHRLGATHVAGKYYLTDQPYLIEGCNKMQELGYGLIKLWFRKGGTGYDYNSQWGDLSKLTLTELAQHPYYKQAFDTPFSTIALSVGGAALETTEESAQAEEQEVYDLTKYLLQTYKDRDVSFILHNWEGDWLLRGGTGDNGRWSRKAGELIRAVDGDRYTVLVPNDSTERCNAMIRWFSARQNGVDRARREITDTRCKVYHAIECNKVMDSMDGIPGIANSVVPFVPVDMVSWSCYDALETAGVDNGLNLYKGVEFIKSNINPSEYMNGEKVVFLGEIGIPEQRYAGLTEKEPVVANWDTYLGVCLALDVPYLIQWELYCNEPKDESLRNLPETRVGDEMRGFWLLRPDGSLSFAGEYFDQVLKNAGGKLTTQL